jgi:hypothetical protein
MADNTAADGALSALRLDPSTVLAVLVLVAAVILLGIHLSVSGSASVGGR